LDGSAKTSQDEARARAAASARAVRVSKSASGVRQDEVRIGVLAPFTSALRHRALLRRLVQRDIEMKFRGSFLGKIWAALVPLIMLGLYTFVFSVVVQPHWQEAMSNRSEIALIYFSGLVLFDFFFEGVMRAPNLMFEHVTYIKKVVFPLEILAWVVLGGAAFRLAVSSVLLLAFFVAVDGVPPLSALFLPLLIAPLGLFALGAVWLLSACAVFVRDIRHMMGVVAPVLMFLTPIFFPLSSVPERYQILFYANPLTFVLEGMRSALFAGHWSNWGGLLGYTLIGWLVAWIGYRVFMWLRPGFADVL
jgi:lipopolysaccharide transport system permease protein